MRLTSKARTCLLILRRSRLDAWALIQIKTEARFGMSLHWLSLRRLLTRRLDLQRTRPVSADLAAYGNYFLDPRAIPDRSIAFSIGVGEDIAFDRVLLD